MQLLKYKGNLGSLIMNCNLDVNIIVIFFRWLVAT